MIAVVIALEKDECGREEWVVSHGIDLDNSGKTIILENCSLVQALAEGWIYKHPTVGYCLK